jgi:hypothetical protein
MPAPPPTAASAARSSHARSPRRKIDWQRHWAAIRWPAIRWPAVRWPAVRWPELRLPAVSLPAVDWRAIRWPPLRWPAEHRPSMAGLVAIELSAARSPQRIPCKWESLPRLRMQCKDIDPGWRDRGCAPAHPAWWLAAVLMVVVLAQAGSSLAGRTQVVSPPMRTRRRSSSSVATGGVPAAGLKSRHGRRSHLERMPRHRHP